jgi:hypothetical protein
MGELMAHYQDPPQHKLGGSGVIGIELSVYGTFSSHTATATPASCATIRNCTGGLIGVAARC